MKYRFFSVPVQDPGAAQDELNRFIASHRVVSVDREFANDGRHSLWCFCVSYFEGQEQTLPRSRNKVDYREVLDAADFAIYAELRALRKQLAERVPAYALFTNEQLADMVRNRAALIHAACFEDRVLHHAIFAHAGPVLERAMVDSSYACRPCKGPLAAVKHAQSALCRYPWYVKIDIRAYFASIDHGRLLGLLARRFKGEPFFALLRRILEGYRTVPGKGLPIGTLASQYFANYYLDALDRMLLERLCVRDHVRYMDDVLWLCDDRAQAKKSLETVKAFASESCRLEVKETAQRNHREPGNRNNNLGFRLARARDGAGGRVRTRPSSCPWSARADYGKKQMAAGMLVGAADAAPNACRLAVPRLHVPRGNAAFCALRPPGAGM